MNDEEVKIGQSEEKSKPQTFDIIFLIYNLMLFVASLFPFAIWFLIGGSVLTLFTLIADIILWTKRKTNLLFASFLCGCVTLVTDVTFILYIFLM